MTRSPVALARKAVEIAAHSLPAYSSRFSRQDFTQHQLFALLTLREFLKTDYRGLEQYLYDWSDLRQTLGFLGITDIEFIYAEGLALGPDSEAKALASARSEIAAALA